MCQRPCTAYYSKSNIHVLTGLRDYEINHYSEIDVRQHEIADLVNATTIFI